MHLAHNVRSAGLPMAFVTHSSTAVPRNALPQRVVASIVARTMQLSEERTTALQALFENSQVQQRFCVLPAADLAKARSLSQNMELYRIHAAELALRAARDCLESAALEPASVDMVITCSCTGVLLPSLSVLIADELGLRSDVRRLPITEAGCAGGAAVLARAYEFVRAFPNSRVLVVAVELPSLTLQYADTSSANLVASAIFGDGAAAVLVQGRPDARRHGVEILATHTEKLPTSLQALGFDLRDGGLHVVLSRHVPKIIAKHLPQVLDDFLSRAGLRSDQLSFCVLHPGGRRVLESVEEALCIGAEQTRLSRDVLRDYGNQSSASVLFVLDRTLSLGSPQGYGLLAAFGPGITVEMSLLRGHPC